MHGSAYLKSSQTGSTALVFAASAGHASCCDILIRAGANINSLDVVRSQLCICSPDIYYRFVRRRSITQISCPCSCFFTYTTAARCNPNHTGRGSKSSIFVSSTGRCWSRSLYSRFCEKHAISPERPCFGSEHASHDRSSACYTLCGHPLLCQGFR